ncbi:hypothetical protein Tco_0963049 [Tanacetum coccineum]
MAISKPFAALVLLSMLLLVQAHEMVNGFDGKSLTASKSRHVELVALVAAACHWVLQVTRRFVLVTTT